MSTLTTDRPEAAETAAVETDSAAPIYSEADRVRDRALCRSYFGAWTGSFGMTSQERALAPASPITFEQFQAAAARLSQPRR